MKYRSAVPAHILLSMVTAMSSSSRAADFAVASGRWLSADQQWVRDVDGPVIALGEAGQFDDTHIFAPVVAHEHERYLLWYCGSTGRVAERVFHLGLATSGDGRTFVKHANNPVYRFGDAKHSVLTPTLLRDGDGSALREEGRLRMWFAATWFEGGNGRHTLHEATGVDGVHWSPPSPPLLENVYAPSVLKDADGYRMWFVDVSGESWTVRHAASDDGRQWTITEEPCLLVDQPWETGRLFYPTVLRLDGVYLMWYGSYWTARPGTTALGFAVSADGLRWEKSPHNPVFRPDPDRPWESHYVTSQSILRLPDGSLRLWYASRKAPPHVNKYFAIGTAHWRGPLP